MTMGKLFDKLLNRKKERHPRCAALVPAAGRSERMGGTDKLTAPLCGVPVLLRTLRALDEAALIDEIVVAVSPERLEEIAALCAGANVKTPLRVVEGGGSRAQSVLLAALAVLGYSTQEVQMALKGVDVENLSLEEIIRQSLKKMVK